MANKAKDNKNKNIIIGICATVVVVVVIVVAIILATRGTQLNDSYFVSDDTKYVLTMETDNNTNDETVPTKTHIVYFYSGDDITGLNYYYEFADENSAKTAYDQINQEESDNTFKEITRDGKYIILVANESEYKDLTANDAKQQIEFMEMLKNTNTNSITTDSESNDTVTIDNVEVEENK